MQYLRLIEIRERIVIHFKTETKYKKHITHFTLYSLGVYWTHNAQICLSNTIFTCILLWNGDRFLKEKVLYYMNFYRIGS